MKLQSVLILLFCLFAVSACTEARYAAHLAKQIPMPGDTPQSQGLFKVGTPYTVAGKRYYPTETYSFTETGIASWYGPGFHGKSTANGEIFDRNELTAAHKTLQMPSMIRVTNLDNGRALVLRVNDRGPFSRGRILDVSERGAELLGFKGAGTAKVRVEVLPEESRKLASAAKAGMDTRGYEIALNGPPVPSPSPASAPMPPPPTAPSYQTASLPTVERETLPGSTVPVHQSADGRVLPDPVVQQVPVRPSGIYIQAGSFSQQSNAQVLSSKLSSLGPTQVYPAQVRGQTFYRVRLGPYADVAQADRALNSLITSGNAEAIIVVD